MKKYRTVSTFFLAFLLTAGAARPAAAAPEDFQVHALSAVLVDADYDEVLFEYQADERRYPASITKVMTGLLTVEAIDRGELHMDDQVTLQESLYTGIGEGGSTQDLKTGEILTVRDLLNCALLPSANEACNALAVEVCGDIPSFVDEMNRRAQELGMSNTHFTNTHGYHDNSHYTTARDVAKMCREAMRHPDFREIVSSVSYTVPATNLHAERKLHDTNALVSNARLQGYLYPYAIGIKTGSTPEAGYCLASAAEKNGRTMIAVVLGGIAPSQGADNYFAESKRLLEHGFNDFSRKEVLSAIDPVGTIPVELCAQQDYVTVQPAREIAATLPKEMDPADFERTIELPESLEAPIQKGEKLGTIHISYEGRDFGSVDLVAATSLEWSRFLYIKRTVAQFLDQVWVKAALALGALAAAFLLINRAITGSGRKKRHSGSYGSGYHGSTYRGRKR